MTTYAQKVRLMVELSNRKPNFPLAILTDFLTVVGEVNNAQDAECGEFRAGGLRAGTYGSFL